MIKKYIIDGNNLIGKISELWSLQMKDRFMSRVKLVKMLDQYFSNKNVNVSLHFDGFSGDAIPSSKMKIYYSNNQAADIKIKHEIDSSKNPKVIEVVSSDHEVQNYARINSCTIVKSEDFSKLMRQTKSKSTEEEINKSIDDDEIKRMFGV